MKNRSSGNVFRFLTVFLGFLLVSGACTKKKEEPAQSPGTAATTSQSVAPIVAKTELLPKNPADLIVKIESNPTVLLIPFQSAPNETKREHFNVFRTKVAHVNKFDADWIQLPLRAEGFSLIIARCEKFDTDRIRALGATEFHDVVSALKNEGLSDAEVALPRTESLDPYFKAAEIAPARNQETKKGIRLTVDRPFVTWVINAAGEVVKN